VDAIDFIMPSTLVGVALLLAATALLATARPRLAAARVELPPGLYASTQAPAAGGGGTTPGSAAAGAAIEPALDAVSRRKLLRWFGWATLLVILGELLAGFLPFFWPKKTGTFGGNVLAGSVGDYKVGDVKKVVEGKFFISRVPEGFLDQPRFGPPGFPREAIGTFEPDVRMTHPSTDGRTTITSPVPVSEVDARLADGWLPAT